MHAHKLSYYGYRAKHHHLSDFDNSMHRQDEVKSPCVVKYGIVSCMKRKGTKERHICVRVALSAALELFCSVGRIDIHKVNAAVYIRLPCVVCRSACCVDSVSKCNSTGQLRPQMLVRGFTSDACALEVLA